MEKIIIEKIKIYYQTRQKGTIKKKTRNERISKRISKKVS